MYYIIQKIYISGVPLQTGLSGQLFSISVSTVPPSVHNDPVPDGSGLVHVRNLDLQPSPQVVEHVDHEPQSLQPPSTTRNEIIHIENTK